MSKVVALSGGIGSGKTSVLKTLTELGATPIDADAIVHELQAPGTPMLAAMADAFGAQIINPDGSLDRKAVADIVFQNPDDRAHKPPVRTESDHGAGGWGSKSFCQPLCWHIEWRLPNGGPGEADRGGALTVAAGMSPTRVMPTPRSAKT